MLVEQLKVNAIVTFLKIHLFIQRWGMILNHIPRSKKTSFWVLVKPSFFNKPSVFGIFQKTLKKRETGCSFCFSGTRKCVIEINEFSRKVFSVCSFSVSNQNNLSFSSKKPGTNQNKWLRDHIFLIHVFLDDMNLFDLQRQINSCVNFVLNKGKYEQSLV